MAVALSGCSVKGLKAFEGVWSLVGCLRSRGRKRCTSEKMMAFGRSGQREIMISSARQANLFEKNDFTMESLRVICMVFQELPGVMENLRCRLNIRVRLDEV